MSGGRGKVVTEAREVKVTWRIERLVDGGWELATTLGRGENMVTEQARDHFERHVAEHQRVLMPEYHCEHRLVEIVEETRRTREVLD